MQIKIICIGDVVGRPGRHILSTDLCRIVKEHEIDCVIVNAENAAGGSGLTPQIYEKLLLPRQQGGSGPVTPPREGHRWRWCLCWAVCI